MEFNGQVAYDLDKKEVFILRDTINNSCFVWNSNRKNYTALVCLDHKMHLFERGSEPYISPSGYKSFPRTDKCICDNCGKTAYKHRYASYKKLNDYKFYLGEGNTSKERLAIAVKLFNEGKIGVYKEQ